MNRWSNTLLPILVIVLGVGSAFLFVSFKRETRPEPIERVPPLVRVITAVPTNYQFRLESQGTVAPRRDIQLVSEVSGRVVFTSPSLAAGGFFNEGDTLIGIDRRDYELARVRAAAQVTQAELRFEQETAEAAVALQEWKELGENRGEPSDLLLRKPQLAQAEAALAAARAELSRAELDLERTEIKAPFAGRVWEKRVDVGQFITPGVALGRLYAVDVAEVRLPVSLPELAYLDLPADYRLDDDTALPDVRLHATVAKRPQTWTGRIVRIEGEIDPRTRMVTLVAAVTDPYDRARTRSGTVPLAVGLFVEAEIIGRSVTNAFILPRTALRGSDEVIVVNGENRLEFRTVEVLRADREKVILSAGLDARERVSISLLDAPRPGDEVRVELEGAAEEGP